MNLSIPRTASTRCRTALIAAEQRWPYLVVLFSLLFVSMTLLLDLKRPLSNDELFTLYISRQPTLHDVWTALLTGAEQLPLFFYVVIRFFTGLFGSGPIGIRLPETLGFLLMNLCAFLFVRRRVPPSYGLISFIFPAVTGAYYYAFEARPYGLVMGFCGLAVLCWQNAAEGRGRPLSLVGTGLFLACAANCHYYAVLLLFPFGVAELVRYYQTRRWDWALYLVIVLAMIPLVFSLPVIRAASGFSSHFWSKPGWTSLISFYEYLLMPAGFALMLMVVVSGLDVYWRTDDHAIDRRWNEQLPVHEIGLALGFVLLPIVGIFLAKFVTGAFTSRHAIYAVLGLALLLAWSLARIGRNSRALGLILACIALGCWLVSAVRQYQLAASNFLAQDTTFNFLYSASAQLPVVIAAPQPFFVQSYVAEREKRGHFVYLADIPLAVKYTNTDTVERGLVALKKYAPLDVQDYQSFLASHERFLVYGFPDPFGWLLQNLIDSGHSVSVKARNGDSLLYLIETTRSSTLTILPAH